MTDRVPDTQPAHMPSGSGRMFLEAVLDGMPDAFFVLDDAWRFRYVNATAARIMGIPAEQLSGQCVRDVFPDQVAQSRFVSFYERAMGGKPVEFEAHFEPMDRWLEVRARPFSGGISVILTDISDRHEIEQRLDRSERLLTALLGAGQIGITVTTQEGTAVVYNDAMERITGYTPADVEGVDWFSLAFPEEADLASAVYMARSALRGDLPYIEVCIKRKDGERRWVSLSMAPIEFDDQEHNFTIVLDIDARKRAELAQSALVKELAAIDQVADVALSTLEPDELLERVLSRLLVVMEASVGIVSTADDHWVVVRDGDGAPRLAESSSIVNLRTFREAPLVYSDEQLGALQVGWTEDRGDGQVADVRLLGLAATRIAAAITNARLHRDITESDALNYALIEINEKIHASLEIRDLIQEVVDHACATIRSDAAVVVLQSGGMLEAQYGTGLPADTGYDRLGLDQLPVYQTLVESREPIILTEEQRAQWRSPEIADALGVRSALLVPLIARGEARGFIGFFHTRDARSFGRNQVRFARNLANSLALALESARLYAAEHEVAVALQDALIEMPERVRGMPIAHAYRSATAMAGSVGGDFYDAFELEGGRAAILIGDVSGKGLGSAVVTSLLRNAVRAHAVDDDSPSVTLAKTNKLAALQTDSAQFATSFLGYFEFNTGELVFCNAGHPPGMLVRADGTVDQLDPNSPLIGAFEHMSYFEASVRLFPGDVLVLVTDGVLEARHGHELFGTERLLDVLKSAPRHPQAIVDAIVEATALFSNGKLADDIAVLAVRYDPDEERS